MLTLALQFLHIQYIIYNSYAKVSKSTVYAKFSTPDEPSYRHRSI